MSPPEGFDPPTDARRDGVDAAATWLETDSELPLGYPLVVGVRNGVVGTKFTEPFVECDGEDVSV